MRPDDAQSADIGRRVATRGSGPPPLDEDTLERLLAGDLPPHEAPPGYAEVAALLAATVAPPAPEELTGQAAALAELRAVTHARTSPARARRTGRRSRRQRVGLAVVAVAAALASGGAAAAAGGRLPGPVREVARNILVSVGGGEPGTSVAPPALPGARPGTTAAPSGPGPTGLNGPTSGSAPTEAAAAPDTERLCRAYLAAQDKRTGRKLRAASFKLLADTAGGADNVLAYCQELLPDEAKSKEDKQKTPPDDHGQGQGPGQAGPPPTTGGDQGGTGPPSTRTSR